MAPLTHGAWAQGPRHSGTYQRYLSWWHDHQVAKAGTAGQMATGGLAPISQAHLRAQAAHDVNAVVGPQLRSTAATINARTHAGQQAITGYTQQLADRLRGVGAGVNADYNQAQAEQQAVNAGLSAFLKGEGATLGQSVSGAGYGDQGVAALGGGAGAGALGYGSSTLSRLIGQGAGERAFGAEQPALAAQQGSRNSRMLQAQGQQDLSDSMKQINSQVPQMVSDLYQSYLDRELQKEIAVQGFNVDLTKTAVGSADNQYAAALGAGGAGPTPGDINNAIANNQDVWKSVKDSLNALTAIQGVGGTLAGRKPFGKVFNAARAEVKGFYPDKPPKWIDAYAIRALAALGIKRQPAPPKTRGPNTPPAGARGPKTVRSGPAGARGPVGGRGSSNARPAYTSARDPALRGIHPKR